jgi:hypothetical protein
VISAKANRTSIQKDKPIASLAGDDQWTEF